MNHHSAHDALVAFLQLLISKNTTTTLPGSPASDFTSPHSPAACGSPFCGSPYSEQGSDSTPLDSPASRGSPYSEQWSDSAPHSPAAPDLPATTKRKQAPAGIEERPAKRFKPAILFEDDLQRIESLKQDTKKIKTDIAFLPYHQANNLYDTINSQQVLREQMDEVNSLVQQEEHKLLHKMRNAWIARLEDTIGDGMYDANTKYTVFGDCPDIEKQITMAEEQFVLNRAAFGAFGETLYDFIKQEQQLKPQVKTKIFFGTSHIVYAEKLQLLNNNAVIAPVDINTFNEREDTKNAFMQCILPYLQEDSHNSIFLFLMDYLGKSNQKMKDCHALSNFIPLEAECLHMFALSNSELVKFNQMQTGLCQKIFDSQEKVALEDDYNYEVRVQHRTDVFSTCTYSSDCVCCRYRLNCPLHCTEWLPLTLAHRELLFHAIVYPVYKGKIMVENEMGDINTRYFTYKAMPKK